MTWKNFRPALVWAFFILILCGFPGTHIPELTFLQWLRPDKIVHLILFGTQCFLLTHSFKKQNDGSSLKKNAAILSVIISISYGITIEIMQEYIFIHRSGDVRDAIANAIGAFTGLWIYNRYGKKIIGKLHFNEK